MAQIQDHTSSNTCLPSAALTLGSAFSTDPVFRWLFTQYPKTNSLLDNPLFVEHFFLMTVRLSLSGNSIVTEISPPPNLNLLPPKNIPHFSSFKDSESPPISLWPCVGIFVPPGASARKGSFSTFIKIRTHLWHFISIAKLGTLWRFFYTLPNIHKNLKKAVFDHPKAKGLKERVEKEGWYCLLGLGTVPECRKNGLGSAFVRKVQQHALDHTDSERDDYDNKHGEVEKAKKPKCVYLETSTLDAKRLYEKCGFECLGEVRFGEGWVDEDGFVEGGKEKVGVRFWGMVWWPESLEQVSNN